MSRIKSKRWAFLRCEPHPITRRLHNRCDEGPCWWLPEGVWYTYVDEKDLDEISSSTCNTGAWWSALKYDGQHNGTAQFSIHAPSGVLHGVVHMPQGRRAHRVVAHPLP